MPDAVSAPTPTPDAASAPTRTATHHTYLSDVISGRELALTIGGLMMSLFLASLNQSIVNTAIPRIVSELNGFEIYAANRSWSAARCTS